MSRPLTLTIDFVCGTKKIVFKLKKKQDSLPKGKYESIETETKTLKKLKY